MGDRYRNARPRSPTLYNPARVSLPINVSGYAPHYPEQHLHVVPSSRREIIPGPRSSNSSISSGPTTTTTYKLQPGPGSSVREGSRTRRSTLESGSRPMIPTIVTAAPRNKPVVHSYPGGAVRPSSPLTDPYRRSNDEYYAISAASGSKHGQHHHRHHKRYSATMDNADMHRLERERDGSRLRVGSGREVAYTGTRNRNAYNSSVVPHRHADTVADDYGDNGYGYTNPRDLVQYDLNNNVPARRHSRRDSFDGSRGRPSSITGYNDIIPRSYDARERGPPPSTRGFDKISARQAPTVPFEWEKSGRQAPVVPYEWEKPQARMPVAPLESVQRPAAFEPLRVVEPERRSSSRRPSNSYQDHEKRRLQREEYYERDDEPRHRDKERPYRSERRDEEVEQRGFGVRPERQDRSERVERQERNERPERPERLDRPDRRDEADKKDHKGGRDALAAGLSLAGAAVGVKAFKDAADDDRDDRDEPRRRRERDHDDEPRRHRDSRDERESVDISGRDPQERRRDGNKGRGPSDEPFDLSSRDPRERRDDRDSDSDRQARRHRPQTTSGVDSRETSPASGEVAPRRRLRRESGATPAFDPKNTMDLMAMKEALNSQTPTTPKDIAPARTPTRTPRESMNKDMREVAEIRSSLNQDPRALRIVTPPPLSASAPPVKGILRQPREKFPEDPTPIREGVAPLKDAKKDGVPPDARWTKISRKLVNPEALEAGKERYEAREDFVIVLRVLNRDEVQQYAEVTETIRAAREAIEEDEERSARRRARRERHERHKRERLERGEREPSRDERRERRRRREKNDGSSSDTTDEDHDKPRMKLLEGAPVMSGGLGISDGLPPLASSTASKRDGKI